MKMVGHKTMSIYSPYAIVDEAMHREGAAKLEVWAGASETAKASGLVKRFKARSTVA